MSPQDLIKKRHSSPLLVLLVLSISMQAQISTTNILGGKNPINIAVPFVTISPDSRANSMGGSGVASSPDVHSQYWNVAKYAFTNESGGTSLSYMPWLRNILPDLNLAYLSGYYKPLHNQAISASIRYFSLGKIIVQSAEVLRPFEMSFDLGYSRQFSSSFSAGTAIRYVHSYLVGSTQTLPPDMQTGKSIALDFGAYYRKFLESTPYPAILALGITTTNLGTPISYTPDDEKVPIPANLRLGGSFEINPRENQSITLNLDLNKLLVSSNSVYYLDTISRGIPETENYFMGLIQSFYDAPGIPFEDGTYSSVLREELSEIIFNLGLEYSIADKYFARGGYFYESEYKGGRQYFSIGAGVKFSSITLDLAYITINKEAHSPLRNTMCISFSKSFN